MLQKLLVPFMFLGSQLLIAWYGYFAGKLPAKGSYLGMQYDSVFLRSLFTQFEYLWVLILINVIFTMAFSIGFSSYNNFLAIIIFNIAAAPIAALIFNFFVAKNPVNWAVVVGVVLVASGTFLVLASKEVVGYFS